MLPFPALSKEASKLSYRSLRIATATRAKSRVRNHDCPVHSTLEVIDPILNRTLHNHDGLVSAAYLGLEILEQDGLLGITSAKLLLQGING